MSSQLKVPADFDSAPSEQRIALVQELWERISEHPEQVPMPPEHRRILDDRLAAYRAKPGAGRPWGEVRDELLTKIRER